MKPETKRCRKQIQDLNDTYRGVVVVEAPGNFYERPISYEILEFKRFTYAVHNLEFCTVVMKCLTDCENNFRPGPDKVDGQVEEQTFRIDSISDLLRDGNLTVTSNIHQEIWYRPDMQCGAV